MCSDNESTTPHPWLKALHRNPTDSPTPQCAPPPVEGMKKKNKKRTMKKKRTQIIINDENEDTEIISSKVDVAGSSDSKSSAGKLFSFVRVIKWGSLIHFNWLYSATLDWSRISHDWPLQSRRFPTPRSFKRRSTKSVLGKVDLSAYDEADRKRQ